MTDREHAVRGRGGGVVGPDRQEPRRSRAARERAGLQHDHPQPGVHLAREVIFAERKFVATPLGCGLRIGGAAEFGGLEARADYERSHALVRLASEFLPGLRREGGTSWAGHRPATPDSLPVIGPSTVHPRVFYAFGHGHLGLTQAATTGRLVADMVVGRRPPRDASPYAIGRFGRARPAGGAPTLSMVRPL